MSTQTKSAYPLDPGSVRGETGSQDQLSAAPSASISSEVNTVSKRRTRKGVYTGSLEFKERAGKLGVHERRILKDYAGDMTETRTIVLEKMESYRRQNNNQPPIVELDSQGAPGGPRKPWKCMICRKPQTFPTFQKVAVHVTSAHWRLHSWPCPLKPCSCSYQALDQLRRHIKKHRSQDLASGGSETFPTLVPSTRLRTIAADESQFRSRPFIEPADGSTPAATSLGSNYVGSGSQSINRQLLPSQQSSRDIMPHLQPQASWVFNQPYPPPPMPALNQFVGEFLPNPFPASLPSTLNAFPLNINNAGQQVRFTGYTQHGQINASGIPMNQDFYQSNIYQDDFTTHWYDDPAFRQAGPSFSSVTNSSGISTDQSHSRANQGGVDAPGYLDRPAYSQPGSGASFASNNFDRSISYSAPPTYSGSPSTPESQIRPRDYPSSGERRLQSQGYVGSNEEMTSDIFWGFDQGWS